MKSHISTAFSRTRLARGESECRLQTSSEFCDRVVFISVSSTEAREASPELARELAEELAEERTPLRLARASANQLNSLGTVVANFACSSASRNRPTTSQQPASSKPQMQLQNESGLGCKH